MANAVQATEVHASTHILSVLVTRADDLPGVWVSHCLNLDVISQGDSIQQALEAVEEAVAMCIQWDLEEDLDPFVVRNRAPDEDWARLTKAMQGEAVPLSEALDESKIDAVVAHYRLQLPKAPSEPLRVPPAWQIAALREQKPGVHC